MSYLCNLKRVKLIFSTSASSPRLNVATFHTSPHKKALTLCRLRPIRTLSALILKRISLCRDSQELSAIPRRDGPDLCPCLKGPPANLRADFKWVFTALPRRCLTRIHAPQRKYFYVDHSPALSYNFTLRPWRLGSPGYQEIPKFCRKISNLQVVVLPGGLTLASLLAFVSVSRSKFF